MCEQFDKNSYLGQMFSAVEEKISYRPEIIGEILFDEYLTPRLAHLEMLPNLQAVLVLALADTWNTLNWRGSIATENNSLPELIFEKPITPVIYAELIIEMAKAVAVAYRERGNDGVIKILLPPVNEDFGSKKIYFTLLHVIIELSLNKIVHNLYTIQSFDASMNMWRQYFQLAAATLDQQIN